MQRSTKISEGLQCSKIALVKIEENLSNHCKMALYMFTTDLQHDNNIIPSEY
jgi:hypothetical protein